MAQEQEYKYPNVCGPQAPRSGEAGRPRTRRTLLLKGLPSAPARLPACLAALLLPGPQPGVLQKFLPLTQRASGTASSPGLLWGKEPEKAGRTGKVAEAFVRPGWAELPNRNCASPPQTPFSGSVRPESSEESPG